MTTKMALRGPVRALTLVMQFRLASAARRKLRYEAGVPPVHSSVGASPAVVTDHKSCIYDPADAMS
jgi:hypothetical protein